MTITADITINNLPKITEAGWEVVTNDWGNLWHYGFYTDKEKALEAVDESDSRFMVKIG